MNKHLKQCNNRTNILGTRLDAIYRMPQDDALALCVIWGKPFSLNKDEEIYRNFALLRIEYSPSYNDIFRLETLNS